MTPTHDGTELVMIRSANTGLVKCPIKGDDGYGEMAPMFRCIKCPHYRGFYQLPRSLILACAKEYGAWSNNPQTIFSLWFLETLPKYSVQLIRECAKRTRTV